MHLKVLLVLLGVGGCLSAWSGTKTIRVNEDGTVMEVITPNGKTVRIVKSRPTLDKGRAVDISIIRPGMPPRTLRIHDDSDTYGDSYVDVDGARIKRGSRSSDKSQSDVITDLFTEYSSVKDEKSHQKFMKKLEKHVEKGEVDPQLLALFRELDDEGSSQDLGSRQALGLGLDPRQGLLERVLLNQQASRPVSAEEIIRERLIEAELAGALRAEQQTELERLLHGGPSRDSQVGRVPYDRWSLIGGRDYAGVGGDSLARFKLLQQIQNSEARNQLQGVRDPVVWRGGFDQGSPVWPSLYQRILASPELLREREREQLVLPQVYENPFSTSPYLMRNLDSPALWSARRDVPINIDAPQLWQDADYNQLRRPLNWQYSLPLEPYNYQQPLPLFNY